MQTNFNTPILFLIFNRPDTTQKVFDEIKKVRPKQLFVVADGARTNEEQKLCNQARKIINQIDWDCEIHKNYSDKNLGCKIRVSSGIDWFFENVEKGIILEDDCVPHQNFFRYCEELLKKYKDNNKIMSISGNNFQGDHKRGSGSYYFSNYFHCWGWATWRRAWKHYNVKMKTFPEFKRQKKIENIFKKKEAQLYWLNIFDNAYHNLVNTWDYQYLYTILNNKGVNIIPNTNLVSNIGSNKSSRKLEMTSNKTINKIRLPMKELLFPLIHPKLIKIDDQADDYTDKHLFRRKREKGIFSLLKKILKKLRLYNFIKKYVKKQNKETIQR